MTMSKLNDTLITVSSDYTSNASRPVGDSVALSTSKLTKSMHCRAIPGHFVLRCGRRQIDLTWIPPDQLMKKAMIKYRKLGSERFISMSEAGLSQLLVGVRNQTLYNVQPNTVYEFGMNVLDANHELTRFPKAVLNEICACKTQADVPDVPSNLRYHYIHGNQYTLEWSPGLDNGEPIETYHLKSVSYGSSEADPPDVWEDLSVKRLSSNRLDFSLPSPYPTSLQLKAVNKVGESKPAYLTVEPPTGKLFVLERNHTLPLDHFKQIPTLLTYGLLTVGMVLFLLLITMFFLFRRRRREIKTGKHHPFLISFNSSRRCNSGSGNDSFGLPGGGSELTTSGLPLDISVMDPLWNQEVNSLYGVGKSDLISFEQVTQISATNIRFQRYIGCGAFGKVWEGWLYVNGKRGDGFEKVALKVRNNKSLSEDEFRREASLMHRYQHANIVRLFGVCFDSPGQQCLVLEMMDQGNLRDYLHKSRPRIPPAVATSLLQPVNLIDMAGYDGDQRPDIANSNGKIESIGTFSNGVSSMQRNGNFLKLTALLDIPSLLNIMKDIAQGCQYLEEQHFVHRDIAARNCLVSHNHPSGRIVKLCDFGLARDIYKNDCYQKRNEPKLPVRWMSPEAIRDGIFTTKSDVWAFGVTCWEVMTLGADPFYGRANLDVMNLVIGGHVLGKPENCPKALYSQMLQCWSRFTEMRPSFADLVNTLNRYVQLAHQQNSLFSGPFVVSLPLPKPLPDHVSQETLIAWESEKATTSALDNPKTQVGTECKGERLLAHQRSALTRNSNTMERNVRTRQPPLNFRRHHSTRVGSTENDNILFSCKMDPITIEQNSYRKSNNHNTMNDGTCTNMNPSCSDTEQTLPAMTLTANTAQSVFNYKQICHNISKGSDSKKSSLEAGIADGKPSLPMYFTSTGYRSLLLNANTKSETPQSPSQLHYGDNNETHQPYKSAGYQYSNGKLNLLVPVTSSTCASTTTDQGIALSRTSYCLVDTGRGVDSLGYERPSWSNTTTASSRNSREAQELTKINGEAKSSSVAMVVKDAVELDHRQRDGVGSNAQP